MGISNQTTSSKQAEGYSLRYEQSISPVSDQVLKIGQSLSATIESFDGTSLKGMLTGKISLAYSDGVKYEGAFVDNEPEGQGKLIRSDGTIFKGQFFQGLFEGPVEITYPNKTHIKANYHNGFIVADSSNLADASFLWNLIGKKVASVPNLYSLEIMSDYLIKKNNKLGNSLKSALEVQKSNNPKKEAQNIYKHLTDQKERQLLLYRYGGHATGLEIIPQGKFVFFEIFNSGEGLENHRKKDGKFKTALLLKCKKEDITIEKLEEILAPKKDIKDLYETLFNIPALKVDQEETIWQTPQKSENCHLEWIFAYLRNRMSKRDYDTMRLHLFEDCLEAIKTTEMPKEEKEDKEIISKELQRKIEKRKKRLASSKDEGKSGE